MQFQPLVEQVAAHLLAHGEFLATAESCTGGGIAYTLTAVAGSSRWFDRGFVTYSNEAKQDMLGVASSTLQNHGAVSADTVAAMVCGALARSRAKVAVAVSGIAGPDGGSAEKPVGTVFIGWGRGERHLERRFLFSGDREEIRRRTIAEALRGVVELYSQNP